MQAVPTLHSDKSACMYTVSQKDGKEATIMQDALIFHLTLFALPHYHGYLTENFFRNRLRGLDSVGGQSSPFPIDLAGCR